MAERKQIHLAGATLGRSRHICAFFTDKDEEYRVLLPFILEGLQQGDRIFNIVNPSQHDDYLERLRRAGVDVDEVQQKGQLETWSWEDTYRRGGRFDKDAMLALCQRLLEQGRAQGFPLTRVIADMEWALEDLSGAHDIVQYEAEADEVLRPYDDPIVCTYDSSKFGGRVVVDILRTHPVAIVGGVLHENPWFMPPQELLKELRSRIR